MRVVLYIAYTGMAGISLSRCGKFTISKLKSLFFNQYIFLVISCPMPDLVGNGSFTQSAAIYLPSTVITYQCDRGFSITGGSSSRTCKSNGVWDGVPPACTGKTSV